MPLEAVFARLDFGVMQASRRQGSAKAILHVPGWVAWSGSASTATCCWFDCYRTGSGLPGCYGRFYIRSLAYERAGLRDRRIAYDWIFNSICQYYCCICQHGFCIYCVFQSLQLALDQVRNNRLGRCSGGARNPWSGGIFARCIFVWPSRNYHSRYFTFFEMKAYCDTHFPLAFWLPR
jgi:hypothetical protein